MGNRLLSVMVTTRGKKYLLHELNDLRQLNKTEYHLKRECLRASVTRNEVFNER